MLSKFELDVEEVVESNHVQEDDEKISLLSNFDLKIKDVSDVPTLVVEEIPHGLLPMRDIQHQIYQVWFSLIS